MSCDCKDAPQEITEDRFVCEFCNTEFIMEDKAEKCEAEHIERKDKHYLAFLRKQEREQLLKVGNHPTQLTFEKFLEEIA